MQVGKPKESLQRCGKNVGNPENPHRMCAPPLGLGQQGEGVVTKTKTTA